MEYLIVCLLWVGYCIQHSFLISTGFTKSLTRLLGKYFAFYRLFYVLFSLWLLIILMNYTSRLDSEMVITYNVPLSVIRNFLMYGSLLLFSWAFFFDYDSLSFFGFRQILNMRKSVQINPDETIKKNGLLGIVRHPMYLALIVFLVSTTFTFIDILINSILIIYVIIGTKLEEKKLVLEFGDAYIRYQHEVPMLIPFTKPKAARLTYADKV